MHLSLKTSQSIDDANNPVNPHQQAADMVVLSFTDSDLACMAQAYAQEGPLPNPPPQAGEGTTEFPLPEGGRVREGAFLCLSSLAPLTHPLSVDLYIEQVASHAKLILVRLLGGYEWWKYGADELARVAREKNITLIMVPGCGHEDERLAALSTVSPEIAASVDYCLAQGGVANAAEVLRYISGVVLGHTPLLPIATIVPQGMVYPEMIPLPLRVGGSLATIIFYRAHYLAGDTAPVDALLESLKAQGINARAFMVSSLKDPASLDALKQDITTHTPDILIDLTAFSAGEDAHPLAFANVPILQCALSNASLDAWQQSQRGLPTTDLAMHVVLPESDGRVFTRAISFKRESAVDEATQFTRMIHHPEPSRIAYVAELAANWVRLAKKNADERRIGIILSDYPDRAGRSAYSVGLDGPQSAVEMMTLLSEAGYRVSGAASSGKELLASLPQHIQRYALADYLERFDALPPENRQSLIDAWGPPQQDPFFSRDAFHFPCLQSGNIAIALQPDRGSALDRKSGYHDAKTPPRHGYLAFYWWLRASGLDALVHLGTHGNLEWLPGKSVALSESCWPEIVLGATPVIYPYIVSDPGEAAQAKRRISAVMLSHLTPPLMPVELSPELAQLETLIDEFSSADGLDARRMKLLREEILHRARRSGLPGEDDNALMTALEAHLCDIKEQRVGNGLHIFGQAPPLEAREAMAEAMLTSSSPLRGEGGVGVSHMDGPSLVLTPTPTLPPQGGGGIIALLHQSAQNEKSSLLAVLDGRFIMPGPGGSPVRGRLDIFPTGRNMTTIDPRMIPTPTAALIGKRAAEEFIRRYMQDHGDWPKSVMIDVWGSATLRNGGDDIAQALWLMGVEPVWDETSHRVSGFTVIPDDRMPWKRLDVSLRISGLFRDMFANLITLFDDAVQAVNSKDTRRVFGTAPGAYGSGVTDILDKGNWSERNELGQAYLDASHFVYGRNAEGHAEPELLKERIANADALIHMQDQREIDVLSGADFADAEGGFAAAASMLGNEPSLYHLDTSRPQTIKVRTLAEEISLTLQSRALSAAWIEGQMRHGYAGGASFADAVDQLFAFAATSDAVPSAQFDQLFDAYLHDEKIRAFLQKENPAALQAMAQKFEEAIRRGLWNPLRNSTAMLLDTLLRAQGEQAA